MVTSTFAFSYFEFSTFAFSIFEFSTLALAFWLKIIIFITNFSVQKWEIRNGKCQSGKFENGKIRKLTESFLLFKRSLYFVNYGILILFNNYNCIIIK